MAGRKERKKREWKDAPRKRVYAVPRLATSPKPELSEWREVCACLGVVMPNT